MNMRQGVAKHMQAEVFAIEEHSLAHYLFKHHAHPQCRRPADVYINAVRTALMNIEYIVIVLAP